MMLETDHEITPIPTYPGWDMPLWLPDDELVSANGLSDEMKHLLDTYPAPDYSGDYKVCRRVALETFLGRHRLKPAWDRGFCQHALCGYCSHTPRERKRTWPRCERMFDRYRMDHYDVFVSSGSDRRKNIVDVVTSQPYPGRDLRERVEAMADKARDDFLELWVSPRQSWHLPGRTVLVAFARPGALEHSPAAAGRLR